MPTAPLIAYAHVGKSFDDGRGAGRVVALDDVSLQVAEGEFLAIVGGSGSGKTTLLRLANRLIEADRGSITVEGADISTVDPVQLRRRIGYVFQSGGLFPHMSVAASRQSCWVPRRPRFPLMSMNCSTWCGWIARSIAIACRKSFLAVSASASAWRGRSQPNRASC